MVGLSPKELASLVRLRHVLYVVENVDPAQPVNWALIAQQCGYYDQAHLNKEFKVHLGYSPTDYLRRRRQLYAENPERTQDLRRLPVD